MPPAPMFDSMDAELIAIAKALKTLDRQEIRHWLKRGELLTRARELNHNEAAFGKWVRSIGQAKRTAYKAIAAWRHFGDVPTSAQFSQVAMDLLAQSPEARAEAIELSRKKRITGTIAKQLLSKHGCGVIPSAAAATEPGKQKSFCRMFELPEGFIFTLAGPGNATPSDQLSMALQLVAALREEVRPPGPSMSDDTSGSGWLRRKAG